MRLSLSLSALACALLVFACETELPGAGDGPLTVVNLDEVEAEEGFVTLSLEAEVPRSRIALMLDLAGPEAVAQLEARPAGGEWAPVDITWREGALAVVRISRGLAEVLEAEPGDLVYVSDRRRWLGGLRSTHAWVADELLNYDHPVIELGPETWPLVVVRGREAQEVRVERLY